MTKEIKIRNVSDDIHSQLKSICQKYQYTSLNQFMLDQLQAIVINDGLNLYQNHFAQTLSELKMQQAQILENQKLIEIRQIGLDSKQEVIQNLTVDWLQFIDDVDALAAERKSGRK
ncbi:MAG: hypothetical protein HXO93_02445 [Streptococcus sanguinis]|jgi:hypothetical protein|uniref:Uncharacterized protein n=1 Tax=Streptococcus sanguinis TaxID=1305 RepID=A0A3P1S3L1_STRSA|nr:hypothetical protein [Streptococcus sanguinis]MBF1699652.1 hypothetical protein [Streptococcus sanguinis]RRC91753.1 hypothetical protein EII39_07125 [Streptococcus sanguinis]